jgi:hypothetical protein
MMTVIELHNDQDYDDLRVASPADLADFRQFGKRINDGNSRVINLVTPQCSPWYVELAKAWAHVSDGIVFKAMLEEWTPEMCRDYLHLDLEIPED